MLKRNALGIAALSAVVGVGLLLQACASTESAAATATPVIQATTGAEPTPVAVAASSEAQAEPTTASEAVAGQLRFVLAMEGNEARYRVREQLVELTLPNDAVGVTSDVTGSLVINADGTLVPGESLFVVDLTTLTSDRARRDNFIKSNTLETSQYPTAEFVATETLGLPSPLPTSGSVTFQLVGDLTIRGVTRSTTWEVTAELVDSGALIGSAVTSFTFDDFELTQPRVPVVLSVEDTITLELDFHFVPEGA